MNQQSDKYFEMKILKMTACAFVLCLSVLFEFPLMRITYLWKKVFHGLFFRPQYQWEDTMKRVACS